LKKEKEREEKELAERQREQIAVLLKKVEADQAQKLQRFEAQASVEKSKLQSDKIYIEEELKKERSGGCNVQ